MGMMDEHGPCEDGSHEWRVHLRSDYIVEVHADSEEAAKGIAEEDAANGHYELGRVAEAIEAWQEEARGGGEGMITVDPGAARIINDAIEEVWTAYRECGNTMDGMVDFGESMRALGRLVGRDLAAEAEEE